MKVNWKKIPESGLPEGCPEKCFLGNSTRKQTWCDDHCTPGNYRGAFYKNFYYADATGCIPDPPEPKPENPPKPDFVDDGFELTGECQPPSVGDYYYPVHGSCVVKCVLGADSDPPSSAFRRWIARKVDPPDRDTKYMLTVLNKIKDVVDESIEEVG